MTIDITTLSVRGNVAIYSTHTTDKEPQIMISLYYTAKDGEMMEAVTLQPYDPINPLPGVKEAAQKCFALILDEVLGK